ncbi:MAG TPA: mycofactocin system transcriptional regulator [Acidimicrobiia bacterium]|nr:mycofactocin system transcriptional regulator [Acidimicrobiia bacterium]
MRENRAVTSLPARRERHGRPPVTTRFELERVALDLFIRNGFAETTLDDIAAAAGIARRTFFGYYSSKNDVVWGDFDALLRGMEEWLLKAPDDVPLLRTLAEAVVRFNDLPPEAVPAHRQRMSLILHVPALQAHSTLRYADWRGVVTRFAARRLGLRVDSLMPNLIGHLALGTALVAYEQWLGNERADLATLLTEAFGAWEIRGLGD